MIFHVSYLGGDMPTLALNFSRPGAQVLLQYYQFLRLGREGYRAVQQNSIDVATYLSSEIEKIGPFELVSRGDTIPVFAWVLKDGHTENWSLYDLADRLRMKGWLVPAYPMADNMADMIVLQRIVVKVGLSRDLASRPALRHQGRSGVPGRTAGPAAARGRQRIPLPPLIDTDGRGACIPTVPGRASRIFRAFAGRGRRKGCENAMSTATWQRREASRPFLTPTLTKQCWGFMIGSSLFALGSAPGFGSWAGASASNICYFVGAWFFTAAGFMQLLLSGAVSVPVPYAPGTMVRAEWLTAATQFVGTIMFNVSTTAALYAKSIPPKGHLVWNPDAGGSVVFLVSGVLAFVAYTHTDTVLGPGSSGWWSVLVNFLGCVAFGVSAVGAYITTAGVTVDTAIFKTVATGLENIYLRGLSMGMTLGEISEKLPEIVEFSELGDAVYDPIQTYSAGMRARLAFSLVFAHVPNILLMDEWISAGDRYFVAKAQERLEQYISQCRTLVLASHSKPILTEICTHGLVLEAGRIAYFGKVDDALKYYDETLPAGVDIERWGRRAHRQF